MVQSRFVHLPALFLAELSFIQTISRLVLGKFAHPEGAGCQCHCQAGMRMRMRMMIVVVMMMMVMIYHKQ